MSEKNVTPAPHKVTVEVGGRPLILETGKIAKQANGAIVARYGDTVVLTTACMAPTANDRDFLPLTVPCKLWSAPPYPDRKSTRLNSSHQIISYAVFCLQKKKR